MIAIFTSFFSEAFVFDRGDSANFENEVSGGRAQIRLLVGTLRAGRRESADHDFRDRVLTLWSVTTVTA
jgi:hypothetical protein